MSNPVLYSLQRCPYCMRARIGLLLAKDAVMLRDVVMKNKPPELSRVSPKATVPVLVLENKSVIDESLDIMMWALSKNDPVNLLYSDQPDALPTMLSLINSNDNGFVSYLEKYQYAKRHHEITEIFYRGQCEIFVLELEQRLSKHDFFIGTTPSLADYAILPFIRQFSRVDRKWFRQAPYPNLQRWLNGHIQSRLFGKAMTKYPQWIDSHQDFLFGAD
jgi:glutathione S-transferase